MSYKYDEETRLALKKMYGEKAFFKSKELAEAVFHVLKGDTPITIVMPTGSGKSLTFMLPAMVNTMQGGGQTTVVIVPFKALIKDLYKRATSLGITTAMFPCTQPLELYSLVLATTDAAVENETFLQHVAELDAKRKLYGIFFDEAHTAVTSIHFRPVMRKLQILRTFRCQYVFLTATLPPSIVTSFNSSYALLNNLTIRHSTVRTNIQYTVTKLGKKGERPQVVRAAVVHYVQEKIAKSRREDKIIVYCRSRQDTEATAQLLGCSYVHSQVKDNSKIEYWMDRGNLSRVICATSALGAGIDAPTIRYVVHFGMPWSLIDFAQESGRAGRDQQLAFSTVFVKEEEVSRLGQEDPLLTYLEGADCRRLALGLFLDGQGMECLGVGGIQCDVCRGKDNWKKEGSSENAMQAVAMVDTPDITPMTRIHQLEHADEQAKKAQRMIEVQLRLDGNILNTVERCLVLMIGKCARCVLLRKEESACRHSFFDCVLGREKPYETTKFFRLKNSLTRLPRGSCCYYCYCPMSICSSKGNSQNPCTYKDILLPFVVGMYCMIEYKHAMISYGIDFGNDAEYSLFLAGYAPINGPRVLGLHYVFFIGARDVFNIR